MTLSRFCVAAGVAMLLLAYAPLGKIRHCLFFFIARGHLGRHYGRRGTFPLRH